MKETCSAFCALIDCCTESINNSLGIKKDKLSGYAILVTVMCENFRSFISRDSFFASKICSYASLPVSIAIRRNKTTETVSFNKHVNAYIEANWEKHIMPLFRSRLAEFHNNDENFSESLSECVNHYFYAFLNDTEQDEKTQGNEGRNDIGELQNIWVKFYNELLKAAQANEYFRESDIESGAALLNSINYFISTHRQEFSDNPIVVDGEVFCTQAAEFYLILFMIAVNDIDPRVTNLLFRDLVLEKISDKSELLEAVSELSEFISSPNISPRAKDIYLSNIYFKWVNNRHTQAVLFDRSVTAEERLNTILTDYITYTDEYLSRKKKNEEKKIPFREFDLRNQEVISRIVPIILKNENSEKSVQLTRERFSGMRHGEECGFVINTDTDSNMDMWLGNWFDTFPENDYSKNCHYYIQMNTKEIKWAAEHRELFVIRHSDNIIGAAIMSTNVNTVVKNRSPYNGGAMKSALEGIGIFEGAYACLNTVIISSTYRGYRLQALLIDILIKLAVIHGKSYVVATVSDINSFSYNNFITAGFVDIDKGKQPSECSVIYNINGEKYPRHLVILDLRNRYIDNTEVPISRGLHLEKDHVLKYINKYWESETCHNPQYKYYDGRNCQNFVSGALVAGGFPLSPKFYPAVIGENGIVEKASLAFVNVQEFIRYMSKDIGVKYYDTQSDVLANAEAFDVLITNEGGHSMIITTVIRDSENVDVTICAAGNTNDRSADNLVEKSVICGLLKTSELFKEQGHTIHTFWAEKV